MTTTDFKTLELSEQVLSQMTNAIQQVAMMNEERKTQDKLDILIEMVSQMNVGHTEEIMNKKEACAYLKVPYNTLNKWILEGLKITKVDRTIRIKKSDIHDFMVNNEYLK